MSNKFRNIFSDEEILFNGKINFKDHEFYKEFLKALDRVQEEGKNVKVNGVNSIEMTARNGESEYSIDEHENIMDFYIMPMVENVSIDLETEYGEQTITFKRFHINKGVVLQTNDDAVVFLKLIFESGTAKVKISYRAQPEKAKSVEELIVNYNIVVALFNKLFIQDLDKLENGITIKDMKDYFKTSIARYEKLRFLEKEFGISIDPENIDQNQMCWLDVEEIYLTLKEKVAIRLNAQINESEVIEMKVNQELKRIEIGETLEITFMTKVEYNIWNNNVSLFAACLLSNAVVKEINTISDKEMKIIYGSEDSRPMYVSYKGFKTEEEANEEMKKIMTDKEEYSEALTTIEHISKRDQRDLIENVNTEN